MDMVTYTDLLPYQEQAVEKLRHLKIGALYMEMGTGKTRTALELVKRRLHDGKVDRVLWLCPCNIKSDIRSGIHKHSNLDDLGILDIVGIETLSTSYKECSRLLGIVKNHKAYLIVDESSLVKNHQALRTIHIQQIANNCKYKLILNGTPVSRNEADLFSQWYLLDWRILGYQSYYSFSANHLEYYTVRMPDGSKITTNQIKRVLNVDYLAEKIAPYTYQIRKEDMVALPPKHYYTRYFDLTWDQMWHYQAVKEAYLSNVDDFRNDTIYKLFTALQHVASGRYVLTGPLEKMKTKNLFPDPNDNPRIRCLKDVLTDDIKDEKVIVFCKYQVEIDEIGPVLDEMGLTWTVFTGEIPARHRQENLDAFHGNIQVMLSNKSCGAFGLNLQFCRNVIFYNNDFDYATRAQAEDRVYRIGQNKEVRIYDICGSDTIDFFIANNLTHKEDMLESFKQYVNELRGKKYEKHPDRTHAKGKNGKNQKVYA